MRLRVILIVMCLAIGLLPLGIISSMLNLQITGVYLAMIFLVTLFLSFFISYFISAPLERLTRTIDDISKGNLNVTLHQSDIEEINTLTKSLNRVLASLKLAIHKVGVQKGEIFEETIKAKQEMEKKYHDLLRILPDWSWEVDTTFTFTFCTPQITNTLGYTPEEIVGKKINDLLEPQTLKKIRKHLKQNKKDPKKIYHYDVSWIHKNGYSIPIRCSFVPLLDESNNITGLRGTAHDITDLQSAHHKISKLQQEIEEYRKKITPPTYPEQFNYYETLQQTDTCTTDQEHFDYTYLFDENAHILDCDTGIAETLGYTKKELVGNPLSTINYLEKTSEIQEKLTTCRTQGHLKNKTIYKTKQGNSVFVSEDITYLPEKKLYRCHISKDHLNI